MTKIELNEEGIKTLTAIMNFSIVPCPLQSIRHEVEIGADKIEKSVT